tara:strand:- start:67 stop:891 length:825 start_codon:yes stop_codon:yes gene_type:complete
MLNFFVKKSFCSNLIVVFAFFSFGCSTSDDSNNDDSSNFVLTITASNTIEVDTVFDVTISTSELMQSLEVSLDNFQTSITHVDHLGDNTLRYFSFNNLGNQTIYFKAKNNAGIEVVDTVTVNVVRGDAIKIESITLNSFFNMGSTWDDEFPTSNLNHLADVAFGLLKPPIDMLTGNRSATPSTSWLWYTATTHNNESSLNWNLQNDDLYINANELNVFIGFFDDDGEFAQDLMLGPPFERAIPIDNYIDSQPISITVNEPDINLNFTVGIDWLQ